MRKKSRFLARGAMIAALYAALSFLQNLLLPGSASVALQFRVSEALCVLALFTPAAIPGLAVGCALFNVSAAGALPWDILVGSAATALAAAGMYGLRRVKIKSFPLPALLMPAVCNGLLVGWELYLHMGGGFFVNAAYIALSEALVLFTLGAGLYYFLRARGLDKRLFA